MLDVRVLAYVTPLAEQVLDDITPVIQVGSYADEDATVTGLIRIYRKSTDTLEYSSELATTILTHGTIANIAALSAWSPGAPADDDYFIVAQILATSFLPGPPKRTTLGAWTFDIKPGPMGPAPAAHHTTHENGGMDELDLTGMSGLLADAQAPTNHATTHEIAGGDNIEVENLGTSEMDDSLVLAPDGAGGVKFRAEAGGGGGGDFMADGSVPMTGYLDMTEIAPPATPGANVARIYSEDFKGYTILSFRDSTGMTRKLVRDSVLITKNVSGAPIPAGQPVYATGSAGNVPTIAPARANAIGTMPAIGITLEAIADTAHGRIMQVGLLENVNTNAFSEGDVLFVDAAVAGAMTTSPPTYPNIRQELGTVLVKSVGAGAIQIIARSMLYETIIDHDGLLHLTSGDPHTQYAKRGTFELFTANGTWTKPSNAKFAYIEAVGAGGGGGGQGGAAGASRFSGTGAGGGALARLFSPADSLTATVAITVGTGGTPGAGGTDAFGTNGGTGGTSTFGAYLSAPGGAGSYAAHALTNGAGGGGTAGAGAITGPGGTPGASSATAIGGQGAAGGAAYAAGGCAEFGGGGGGGNIPGAAGGAGGSSLCSAAGGGAGGILDTNTERAGGAGGQHRSYTAGGGGTGGTTNGGAGQAGADGNGYNTQGNGGGGGGAQDNGTGGAGGNGGNPGGGAGGGGAGTNTGGNGGTGGRGEIRIWTWF
jgi:hypothetical protein